MENWPSPVRELAAAGSSATRSRSNPMEAERFEPRRRGSPLFLLGVFLLSGLLSAPVHGADVSTNKNYGAILAEAAVTEDSAAQIELVKRLVEANDELVSHALAAWRQGELYLYTASDGVKSPFVLESRQDSAGKAKGIRVANGEFIQDASGAPVLFAGSEQTAIDTTSRLRRAIKTTLDLFATENPAPKMRRDAIVKLGQERNAEYLPHFEKLLRTEANAQVTRALTEAIALTQCGNSDPVVRNAAIQKLGEMRSINARDFLKELEKEAKGEPVRFGEETLRVLRNAIVAIETHIWWGNLVGTAFRGLKETGGW